VSCHHCPPPCIVHKKTPLAFSFRLSSTKKKKEKERKKRRKRVKHEAVSCITKVHACLFVWHCCKKLGWAFVPRHSLSLSPHAVHTGVSLPPLSLFFGDHHARLGIWFKGRKRQCGVTVKTAKKGAAQDWTTRCTKEGERQRGRRKRQGSADDSGSARNSLSAHSCCVSSFGICLLLSHFLPPNDTRRYESNGRFPSLLPHFSSASILSYIKR